MWWSFRIDCSANLDCMNWSKVGDSRWSSQRFGRGWSTDAGSCWTWWDYIWLYHAISCYILSLGLLQRGLSDSFRLMIRSQEWFGCSRHSKAWVKLSICTYIHSARTFRTHTYVYIYIYNYTHIYIYIMYIYTYILAKHTAERFGEARANFCFRVIFVWATFKTQLFIL